MSKVRITLVALVLSLFTLVGFTALHNIEFKAITEYRTAISQLGHKLVANRDSITLQSIKGIQSSYELNRGLVAIEKDVRELSSIYTENVTASVFFNRIETYDAVRTFHDAALEVAQALDRLVGVIVARESVLSSFDIGLIVQNENSAKQSVLVESLLSQQSRVELGDENLNRLAFIFSDLHLQKQQLFNIILSGKNADFVEVAEHKLSQLATDVRNRYDVLLYLSLLNLFLILGVLGFHRAKELQRNNHAYKESVAKSEQASKAKSLFLATMSHELRTPMNGVLGIAELIKEQSSEIEVKKQAQTIVDSGEHLVTLLNDILDFSKIEEGKMRLEASEFDMSDVTKNIESTLHSLAANKQIELNVNNHIPSNMRVIGDSARLRQVLYNVVGNGIKFTEKGEVSLSIDYHKQQKENVHFTITDTGFGIERERLNSIFNAFEQADLSTTRKFGGTGLGLAIVKQLVELMDGTIDVFSQPNVGTQVVIKLPMQVILHVAAPREVGEYALGGPAHDESMQNVG
ncbi:sensor histidine kinase [Vibrio astriarenae]